MKLAFQQRRRDVGVPGRQNGGDMAPPHHPQSKVHVFRRIVFDGEYRNELAVHRQENAGFQIDVPWQAHVHLPHEGGRAHQHRLPVDGRRVPALFIKAEIVGLFIVPQLSPQQAVEQPLQAAAGGTGHGGGVGDGFFHLLAVDLHAVELHGAGREQVCVRHDHVFPSADLLRAGPAGHGAARLLQAAGQLGPGQAPAQGQGEGGARRQNSGPVQQKITAPALAQRAEPREHDGGRQHHRQ